MQQILLTLIRSIECERNMMTVLRVYLNVYTFAGIRFFFLCILFVFSDVRKQYQLSRSVSLVIDANVCMGTQRALGQSTNA